MTSLFDLIQLDMSYREDEKRARSVQRLMVEANALRASNAEIVSECVEPCAACEAPLCCPLKLFLFTLQKEKQAKMGVAVKGFLVTYDRMKSQIIVSCLLLLKTPHHAVQQSLY